MERLFLASWSVDAQRGARQSRATTRFNPHAKGVSDYGWGGAIGAGEDGVLPVWACGLGRTLLAVEVRNAYWRQFHAMRVQAFNHATVFPRDSTAKPLHIRTAISSQGGPLFAYSPKVGPLREQVAPLPRGQQQWMAAEQALG